MNEKWILGNGKFDHQNNVLFLSFTLNSSFTITWLQFSFSITYSQGSTSVGTISHIICITWIHRWDLYCCFVLVWLVLDTCYLCCVDTMCSSAVTEVRCEIMCCWQCFASMVASFERIHQVIVCEREFQLVERNRRFSGFRNELVTTPSKKSLKDRCNVFELK